MHTSDFCASGVHPPHGSVMKCATTLRNVLLGSRPASFIMLTSSVVTAGPEGLCASELAALVCEI